MPEFTYNARDQAGTLQQGQLESADRRAALRSLQLKGWVPVSVAEVTASPAARKQKADKSKRLPVRKLPTSVLLQFSIDLRDLLEAGLTVGSAVQKLSRQSGNPGRAQVLKTVHEDIVQGKSLSEALEAQPLHFPEFYVSLVNAGEASGQLPDALNNAVRHYERSAEAKEQVVNALVYPVIVLVVGAIVILFSMIKVIPRFTQVFTNMDRALPLPTRILMGMSRGLVVYGPIVAVAIVVLAVFFARWKKTPAGRMAWHGFLLKVPVVNPLIRSSAYANFARTLSNLLHNGVPVLTALDIVRKTTSNAVLEKEIAQLKERVTDGASLSRPLAESGVFPDVFTDMLSVGEEAGQVPRALSQIAKRYDQQLTRDIKRMTSVVEPLLMVIIASAIGFVAISMLLPVFTLTQGLR